MNVSLIERQPTISIPKEEDGQFAKSKQHHLKGAATDAQRRTTI
jgi:hypothetical protein